MRALSSLLSFITLCLVVSPHCAEFTYVGVGVGLKDQKMCRCLMSLAELDSKSAGTW